MKTKAQYILLLLLPVLFLISGIMLRSAQGPFYLNFYDPSYQYLINSLNLAQKFGVGHFDHPGTTVQVIGAVSVKLQHMTGGVNSEIAKDVLTRPEDYLQVINKVLIAINSIVLFLLGLLTLRWSKNIYLSLLIQLSPFVSLEIFYGLKIVSPDNLLIAVSLSLIGLIMFYLFKVDPQKRSSLSFVIVAAVICGFGMATKISFLPFLIIPFVIINGIKNKLLYCGFVILSFLIFVLPAISNYAKFGEWVGRLFFYTGSYGQGTSGVVDVPDFFENMRSIFTKDVFFAVTYVLSFLTLAFRFISPKINDESLIQRSKKEWKILFTVFIAITIQVIMVSKQYRQHYMIPSFVFCILLLSISASLISTYLPKVKLRYSYPALILVIASFAFPAIVESYSVCKWLRSESYMVEDFINNNKGDAMVIPAFGSASKDMAIVYGISGAGKRVKTYKVMFSEMQNNYLFYFPWQGSLYTILDKADAMVIFDSNKKIIFHTVQDNVVSFLEMLRSVYNVKIVSSKLIFENKINEKVYEIQVENVH
ncbi:MAG: hypothetical protein ABI528_02695 [bacterium]